MKGHAGYGRLFFGSCPRIQLRSIEQSTLPKKPLVVPNDDNLKDRMAVVSLGNIHTSSLSRRTT